MLSIIIQNLFHVHVVVGANAMVVGLIFTQGMNHLKENQDKI